jgi:hypothetical protein
MYRRESPPCPLFLIVEIRIKIEASECLQGIETLAPLNVFLKSFIYGSSFRIVPAETLSFIDKLLVYVEICGHSRPLFSWIIPNDLASCHTYVYTAIIQEGVVLDRVSSNH